jgi:hypothetical protein
MSSFPAEREQLYIFHDPYYDPRHLNRYDGRIMEQQATPAPTAPSPAPAFSPAGNRDAQRGFGWFLFSLVMLLLGFCLVWCCWISYRKRREQRMLNFRSAQADRVLGDMQMVPNEDYDDEII